MKKALCLICIYCLCLNEMALAKTNLPDCLAGICLYDKLQSPNLILKTLGKGQIYEISDVNAYCYEIEGQGYLTFFVTKQHTQFIEKILASELNFCGYSTKINKKIKVETNKGLKIGDMYDDVLKMYGKPQHVVTNSDLRSNLELIFTKKYQRILADKALIYRTDSADELFSAWIFLKGNRVTNILLDVSE